MSPRPMVPVTVTTSQHTISDVDSHLGGSTGFMLNRSNRSMKKIRKKKERSSLSDSQLSTDRSVDNSDEPYYFEEGMKVEANYRGKGNYYSGKIKAKREDGTFDILYDDGEEEERVIEDFIREHPVFGAIRMLSGHATPVYYRSGTTTPLMNSRRPSTASNLTTARNSREKSPLEPNGLDPALEPTATPQIPDVVAALAAVSTFNSFNLFVQQGTKVEANYRQKGKYLHGKIARDRHDGTYDIDYDDGEKETNVSQLFIRVLPPPEFFADTYRPTTASFLSKKYVLGQKVKVKNIGSPGFTDGTVLEVVAGGGYMVQFSDGRQDELVVENRVSMSTSSRPTMDKAPGSSSNPTVPKFTAGEKVEGNYRGRGKWLPGTLSTAYPLCIKYDNGEEEEIDVGADEPRIRRPFSSSGAGFTGTGVVAGATYLPRRGSVIRPAGISEATDEPLTDRGPFNVGEKIEANFGGKGMYRPATVVRRRLNGSYDLDYDDGEKEQVVEVDMIRARRTGRPADADPATVVPTMIINTATDNRFINDPIAALTIPTARLNVNGVRLQEGMNETPTIPHIILFLLVNNHTLTLN